MKFCLITLGVLCLVIMTSAFAKTPIRIVAAENVYGDLAEQIGGTYVQVTSIMNNPNQDPHLFSSSPATAKAIAHADIVIYNGLDYDAWMPKLLSANRLQPKVIIIVADLVNQKTGENPHIWYDPKTIATYVNDLTQKLSELASKHAAYFQQQTSQFQQQFSMLTDKINELHAKYQGTLVIATEPVFGYMATALGLDMQGQSFQLTIMNGAEPSATHTRDFEDKLKNHAVKVFIYNNQVISPQTDRMKHLAEQQHIPVVGVSETQPLKKTYIQWMMQQLQQLQQALNTTVIAS